MLGYYGKEMGFDLGIFAVSRGLVLVGVNCVLSWRLLS